MINKMTIRGGKMKRSYLIFIIRCLLPTAYCLLLTVLLGGCGDSTGGGGAVYDTVTLTASSGTSVLDSDVATHSDVTNCGTSTDSITVSDNSVDVTINSTTIPNLPSFVTTSQVRLDKVTVKYTPANQSSPSLSDQNYTLGTYVDAGGSATVSVRVASQAQKSSSPLSNLTCTNTIYSYYVTLKFEGVEVNTDVRESFETTLNVNFADFVD